jgi:hypothetical protein
MKYTTTAITAVSKTAVVTLKKVVLLPLEGGSST